MKFIFFIIFFLILKPLLYTQNMNNLSIPELDSIGDKFYYSGDYENCLIYSKKSLEKATLTKKDSIISNSLNNLGLLYQTMGRYAEAEPLLLKAVKIRRNSTYLLSYAVSLNNLALLYHELMDYEQGEYFYLLAKETYKKAVGENSPDYAQCLNNLAGLLRECGKIEQSEAMYKEAIDIRKKSLGSDNIAYAETLNNLAALYTGIQDYENAEKYYLISLAIFKKVLGKQHPKVAVLLANLGVNAKNSFEFGKAEEYYKQSLDIFKTKLGNKHPQYLKILVNLARLYTDTGRFKEALSSFLKYKSLGAEFLLKPESTTFYINFAHYYIKNNQPDSALSICREGLVAASPDLEFETEFNFDEIDKFRYVEEDKFQNLILRIIYAYDKKYKLFNHLEDLESAYKICKTAIRYNEKLKNRFSSNSDKLKIIKSNNKIIALSLEYAGKLGADKNFNDAFSFSELNKSMLLSEATKTQRARSMSDLPDSLTLKELELERLADKLKKTEIETKSEEELAEIHKQNNALQIDIIKFKANLERKYPKYYKLKYEQTVVKAEEIQKLLSTGTAFIEYYVSDSIIFAFYIDKQKKILLSLPITRKLLSSKVSDLRKSLADYQFIRNNETEAYMLYTSSAYWFYKEILAPLIKDSNNKQLIIVADGELGHLPFESFLTSEIKEKKNYAELPYIINTFKVSYNYSATLWKENLKQKKSWLRSKILAVAASYSGGVDSLRNRTERSNQLRNLRDALQELPAAREEVKSLSEVFSGQFWQDAAANEWAFKAKAKDFGVIHLAMHSVLNNNAPILSALAFTENGDSIEDNMLEAWEIAHMRLNAQLVVLSACETGYGKFIQGEGIMSLARSFMYAGVPSLVVSLWQVNDYSTSLIMKLFYKNLDKGMNKAEALQMAKLEYIRNNAHAINQAAAHPTFWAAFILLGDSSPISISKKGTNTMWFWLLGAVLLLAVSVPLALGLLSKTNSEE